MRVDASLGTSRSLLNTHLGKPCFDGFGHTTHSLHLLDMLPSTLCELVGKRLYIVGTAPRIYLLADHGFLLNVDLSITSNTSRKVRREGNSFVQRIRMQRLSMPESSCHGFDTSASYIVEGVLLCKRPSRRLTMCTKSQTLGIGSPKTFDNLCPKHTCGTHLGNLHKVIYSDSPEERETRSKLIYFYPCVNSGTEVLDPITKGVSHFYICRSPSLLHMIA